jgi:hypothetical protein
MGSVSVRSARSHSQLFHSPKIAVRTDSSSRINMPATASASLGHLLDTHSLLLSPFAPAVAAQSSPVPLKHLVWHVLQPTKYGG